MLPSGAKKTCVTGSPTSTVAPEACKAAIKLALSSTAKGSVEAVGKRGVAMAPFPQPLTIRVNIKSKTDRIRHFIKHLQINLVVFHLTIFNIKSSHPVEFFGGK